MADFRAIYHLSPAETGGMAFPEYLALAYRVSAYPGVMQARMAEEQERDRRMGRRPGVRNVPGERQAVEADPLLRDAISFG